MRCMATPCKRLSLHFSPRGEAKCVSGPSGRGASRAEEKGARRRTCRIASFTPRVKKHGLCGRCVRRRCSRDAQSETPPGTPRTPPGRCFPARHGAAMARLGGILPPEPVSARRPHRQHELLGFTKHETRNTGFFFRVLRPSDGEKCRFDPPQLDRSRPRAADGAAQDRRCPASGDGPLKNWFSSNGTKARFTRGGREGN